MFKGSGASGKLAPAAESAYQNFWADMGCTVVHSLIAWVKLQITLGILPYACDRASQGAHSKWKFKLEI